MGSESRLPYCGTIRGYACGTLFLCTMLLSHIFRLAACLVESESDSEPGILQCKLKVAYQETHALRYSKVEHRNGISKKKTLLVVVVLTVSAGSNKLADYVGRESTGKRGKAYCKLTTSAKVCEINFSRTMQTGASLPASID